MEHHQHHQPHLLHHNNFSHHHHHHLPFGPPPSQTMPTTMQTANHHQILDLDMYNITKTDQQQHDDTNDDDLLDDDEQFRSRANTWPVNRLAEHHQQLVLPPPGGSGGAPSDESKNSTPVLDITGRNGTEKVSFDPVEEEENDNFDENAVRAGASATLLLVTDDADENGDDDDDEDTADSIKEEDDDDEMLTDDAPMKPVTSSPTKSTGGAKKKCGTRRNAWGNQSYADLITQAIMSTPDSRLTLAQIYEWMTQNLPYFRDKADSNSSAGWKNSIRHNLSLHNKFIRLQNEGTGKSSWWTLNPNARPGKATRRRAASMDTKTYEKRRGRVKKRVDITRTAGVVNGSPSSSITDSSSTAAQVPRKVVNGGVGGGGSGGLLSESSSLYPPGQTTTTVVNIDPTAANNSILRQRSGSSASSCNSRRASSPFTTAGAQRQQQHTGSNGVTSTTDLLPPASSCQASTTTAPWDIAAAPANGHHHHPYRYDAYQNDQYLTQTLAGTRLNGGNNSSLTPSTADLTLRQYPHLAHHRNSVGGYITSTNGGYGTVASHQTQNRFHQQQQQQQQQLPVYSQQRHNSLSIPVGNSQTMSHLKQHRQAPPYGSVPNHASLLSSPGQTHHHFAHSAYQHHQNGSPYGREFNSITDKLRATLVSKQQQQQQQQNQQQQQQSQHNPFSGGVCIPYNNQQQAANFNRNPYSSFPTQQPPQQQQNGTAAKTSPGSTTLLASPSATASPQSTTLSPHHTPSPLVSVGRTVNGYPCSMSPSQFYTTAGAPSSSMSSSAASSVPSSTNGSAYLPADLQSIDIQPLGMYDQDMQFLQNDLRDGGLVDFNNFSNGGNFAQNGMIGIANGSRVKKEELF